MRAAGGAAFALCPRMAEGTRTLAGARAPSTGLQPHDSAPFRSPHLLTPSPWGSGFSARISEGRALSDPSGGDGRGERHRLKISCHDFNPREWPGRAMGRRGHVARWEETFVSGRQGGRPAPQGAGGAAGWGGGDGGAGPGRSVGAPRRPGGWPSGAHPGAPCTPRASAFRKAGAVAGGRPRGGSQDRTWIALG